MIMKIRYGNSVIQYSVVKSKRRKTSEIIVDKKGVVIRTPFSKSNSEVRKIVEEKGKWIFKKQLEFGKRISITRRKFYSRKYITKRVNFYASKIGIFPQEVNIKKLKSRWGSATKDNVINLNENLLKAPKDVIDYVILHEICHLKIRNHSHHFWNFLNKFMSQYEKQKKWLEINGHRIS